MLYKFRDPEEGLYGYKNEKDEIVIVPQFEKAEEFTGGLAEVADRQKSGLIDERGKVILPYEYDYVIPSACGWVHAKKANHSYLFTREGHLQVEVRDIISWYFPREDMIRAKKNTGWGYMNLEGETVIPFIYRSLGPVFNGRLSLFDNGQWGWLNAKGEIITAACFDEVGWWNDTLWWARKHGRYSLYDLAGAVVRDEGWTKILTPDRELAVVKTGSYWKYINHAFETVLQLPPIYDGVEYFNEGFAAVKRNGAWGFIDRNGREVIAPVYEQVGFFSEGLASVRQGGDWGYIDRAGIMVIPCRYGFAASFKNGRARVRDKWYSSWYINQQGETVAVIELLYGDG